VDWGAFGTFVGDVLAAGAVVVAVITLRHVAATAKQARNDLREDRQIDFRQSVLLDIAVSYEEWARGGGSPFVLAARVRVLPTSMLPLLRAALALPVSPVQRKDFEDLAASKGFEIDKFELVQGYASWIREEIHAEINEALDRLDKQRP
jgi:hypothetical protein